MLDRRGRSGAGRGGCRVQQVEASEHLGKVQADGYRVSGELARIEQQIQHQRELKQRLEGKAGETPQSLGQRNSG